MAGQREKCSQSRPPVDFSNLLNFLLLKWVLNQEFIDSCDVAHEFLRIRLLAEFKSLVIIQICFPLAFE